MPPLDLKKARRFDIFYNLSIFELCTTEKGRGEFLDQSTAGIAPGAGFGAALAHPPQRGRLMIIKGILMQRDAVGKPRSEMTEAYRAGAQQMLEGYRSVPRSESVVCDLVSVKVDPASDLDLRDAQAMVTRAYLRAMKRGKPPMTLDTKDLISPIDGLPVRYHFDGTEMVIDAGEIGDQKTAQILPGASDYLR